MIQRADRSYFAMLWIEAEKGGFWTLHHQGMPAPATSGAFPEGLDLAVEAIEPFVARGRWLVKCPNFRCGGMQLASPDVDVFFCIECNNAGNPLFLRVAWYGADAIHAIESALEARPDPLTRNWQPNETVGFLLAENHGAALLDESREAPAGDVGFDQQKVIGSGQPALRRPALVDGARLGLPVGDA